MIQPTISDRFTVAGMLSSSGRCKTLDAFADGYVRAEACLSLLLINTDTMAQNNYVQHVRKESVLVLHGSAVNQDGRSSALTAPRGPSQSEVIMKATNSQTKFLCMVQLHGTGTSLGDPIEIGALSIFLHKKSMIGFSDEVLKLDGMKSWMGHAEPAAGIFGLSEICENVACKSHNGQNLLLKLNPYISSIYDANGTICVSREGVWFEGQCQNSLSGVSAFAFQGTNAHCVARYLDYFNCRSFHLIMNMKSASTLLLRCQHFKCTLQGISQSVHIEFDLSCKFGVLDHCIMGHYLFPAAGYFQLTTELKSMFSDGFPVKGGVEMNTEGRYPSSLLIPGGTGSIGMCTVTWYAQTFHGPKHILIPCRSGRSRTFYAKQFRSRVQIQLCCSDVSASSCLTPCSLEPDSWIFHVSGCISDAALHNQTMASIRYVFAPKYTAALKLSEKNAQHPIRAFIGFSSISALVGSAGQSNYAAANASIDAFSAQECHIGRVFTSIQWGPWIGLGGMVSQNIKTMQRMEALGTGFIDSYTGIQILKFIVNSIPYHNGPFVASPFRWDKFIPRQPIGTLVTCIYNEVGSCLRNNLNLSKQKIDHKSTNVSLMEVKDIIHSVLTKKIGDIVSFDAPLMEAGLDSLSVIDVRESLEKIFRIELPVSIFFDYPTAEATTKYIASLLNDDGQLKSNECMDECLYFQRRTRNDDISISAYSGGNPHQLEDNINAVPLVRWDTDLAERNHLHGGKFAGFCTISTLAFFDIKLFSFGEKEALYIDPRQRLLLFQVSSILKEKTLPHALQQYLAVVIGASGKDYVRLLEQWVFEDNCTYTGIGNELSVLSGRISYTFDCKSKCLVIDTACSSSLVGVHIAKEDCLFGYSKGALSAGASIIVTSELHKVLGGAGMLSLCGRCKTLEASADGYSRAECIVTVLLVNASTMLVEDKCDPILIGSSVNQDGRSSSLTAPNGPSQHEVIKNSVLNTDGEDSRIIQIHGTGTALGDPLEVAALISALSLTKNIIIESIKTWMGHAEPAAGILGMTALLSAQASVKTPGFCHLRNFNPHVVAASQKHSTTRKVRQNSYLLDHTCGGVSAFAFQGTNVHCSILSAGYHSNQSALRFLHNNLYWPVLQDIIISGLSGRLNNSKFPVILRCCGSIEISRYFSSRQVKYSKPPHLVVYASGCLSDAALRNQTMASIRYVFAPKNKLLKSMSKENSCRPIFKIIGFSSISALVGSAGQSNYAAANASIDAFSAQECHIGRVFTSIQWGPWIGLGGMVSQNIKTMQRMEALGLDGIKPLPGIRAFEICMKSILFHSVETICGFKWEAFLSQFNLSDEDRETYILFKISVKPESIDRKDHTTVSKHDIKLNTKERAQYVIKRAVKDALGFKVHENEPLINSGLDSLSSQELIARISEELGINLPVTVIYDHPSVNALVTRCSDVKKIDYLQPVQKRTNECQIPHSSSSFIIGHSGVFCGGNCDEHLLYSSGCSTNVIPLTRWDTFSVSEQLISSKSMDTVPLHFCATISSSLLTTFDHRIFGISQAESMCIDPQQRLIVESTLQTLQITCSHDSSNMDVATFVGIQHMEYNLLNQGINCIGEPYIATGSALSVAAGRISFIFDFNGPAVSIDTACSASLATVHFAYNSSNLEIFCCGVNLTLTWENFASIQRAGMLTQDGRCKTLDARADGYGRGESSIVARVAKFDSESIKSTKYTRNAWKCDILASAMKQDGRSSSLTAPSGIAQQRVLNSAAKDLNQKQLGSVGLHGTGTSLGDPIELGALSQTLEFLCLTHVSIMASKIQASHTETAAGLVSLVQIVSSLDFELRAPFDHIIYVNPYVVTSFSGKCSTFLFERMSMPTTQAAPAGVSAFAFMGTNVHVIIEYRNINLYSKLRIQSCNRIMLFNRKYSWNETEIGKILLCCAFFTHARNDNVNLLFYPTRERNFNNIVLAEVMITCAFTLKGQAAFLTHASFCSPKGITRAMQSNEVEISMHPKSGQIHCKNTDVKLAVCTIHAMYIYSELQKRLHHLELGENMNTNMNALKCIVHVPSAKNTHVSSAIEVFLLNTCLKSIGFFVSIQSTNKFLIAREILVGFSIYCRDIIFSRITDHGAENAYFEHQTENTEKSENTYSLNCINNGKELGRIVSQSLELILGRNIGECELFQDLGLDSIGCVEVANHIRRDLELEFDISEVAALPTKRAIIEHLGHLQIENEKTEPRNTTILTTQNIQSINDDNGMQSTMTKVLRPTFEALPLFLGAPAFGDGPLAYMRLINTLNLGHHPVITLERDTTKQAWPNAAEVHAQTIMKQQRRGIITLGGHSLGGVLAIETAVSLELCGREVGVVLLFDAPHPVQFKSEWGIESSSNLDCSNTSTGLEYMEIALTSFHFDTTAAGWRNLDKIQKYSIFEDVMFQALGREIDARDLDEQISGGPYADQWNSGITRNPHNRTCDVSNWKLLRGSDENQVKYTAREANEEISKQCKNFHRVEAKVVQFKACNESAALFEIDLFMDKSQSEILRSVSGYVWPLACNNVEIVRCRGSHMNLMTPDIDG
ncbi:unnamed protein product [Bathycoccus prasinos]